MGDNPLLNNNNDDDDDVLTCVHTDLWQSVNWIWKNSHIEACLQINVPV